MFIVQRSFHHIEVPTRLHRATRHIQSFKKLPPPLIKVACGSAFSRGQLLPGADWETNDLPLFKKKLITHFPNAPKGSCSGKWCDKTDVHFSPMICPVLWEDELD